MKRGTTIHRAGLELVFARELPRPGGGEVEAYARVRVERRDDRRSERLVRARAPRADGRGGREHGGASGGPTLRDLLDPWPLEPLPQLVESAIADDTTEAAPRVWMSAESQSWLAKHAPRTFKLLLRHTELCQRDACFALVREGDHVRLAWRAEGALEVEARPAPLFATAHALARGRVRGTDADDDSEPQEARPDGGRSSATRASAAAAGGTVVAPEALRLVRAYLVGTWITGRLAHELEWIAATRSYRLRDGQRALYLREGQGGGRTSIWLSGDGLTEPLEVAVAPPLATPAPVVRAGLEWLLAGGPGTDGELFLDASATHVRELGS
ncbi:hypothetical protein Pla163_32180 [Planctomycetes bacterium Pla163]|uniref:Uncharacterized protein n=1 Tax=Rohdeia mirabilis TaxID=2528008 RepID=A0A518D3P0_9BACT|nr:hypothetical protein Pla163_32180 [Planctomycetes bacterium Pla163]